MKIGIYGGTFNPIHYGHLRTAEEIFEKLCLDTVIFIPAGRTPFDKPDLEKAGHRYKMVQSAIESNDHFRISNIEMKSTEKSFTVDTIGKLRGKFKGSEFFFILGTDAFLDLPGWKQPGRLLELTNVVIISRPGYPFIDLSSSPYLGKVPKKVLREVDVGIRSRYSFDISKTMKGYLCKVTGLNISASSIRDLIMSGKNIKYLLPDSVKSYIISHNLYQK